MGWRRVPIFSWSVICASIIQLMGTSVVAASLIMVMFDRMLHTSFFRSDLGGNVLLYQHLFWYYSHPAVYIMILPAMGVVSELIATFSQKTIFGYKAIALSSVGIAAVSFFVWGHHMFVSGQSEIAGILFSFITMLVGVPTAIKVFNWTATLYRGSIRFDSPMLFALGFLFLFTIGGVTGIILATVGVDVHFHDTYFVVAHFHYVMVGGTLMAIMGGIYYWFPKMFGRMVNEAGARLSFVLIFIGFNVTFFPQFVLGAMGMPRRYFDYLPEYASLNKISSIGAWTIGLGFLIGLVVIIHGWLRGEEAGPNPWNSKTLEWQTPSPPPHENFITQPVVTAGPYEYR
jgi:cytochrome c oxidase subunit 1